MPAGSNGIDGGCSHEAEGAASIVGPDEENAAGRIDRTAGMMIHVVFVVVVAFVNSPIRAPHILKCR